MKRKYIVRCSGPVAASKVWREIVKHDDTANLDPDAQTVEIWIQTAMSEEQIKRIHHVVDVTPRILHIQK